MVGEFREQHKVYKEGGGECVEWIVESNVRGKNLYKVRMQKSCNCIGER